MNDQILPDVVNDNNEKLIEKAKELFLAGATNIPKPLRKNALKAFDQLCTALIDIPVAYLEGHSKQVRTTTNAKVDIINAQAKQVSQNMNVPPEYIERAMNQYIKKIIKKQRNLDSTSEVAMKELLQIQQQSENEIIVEKEIDDDWLNTFSSEASNKSSRDMQILFGKILTNEIRQPGNFSIKTIKTLGQLNADVALLFKRLCSLSISKNNSQNPITDVRMLSLGKHPGDNSLLKYGLDYDSLNTLQEYGLIIPDYNSYSNYHSSYYDTKKDSDASVFFYQNKMWVFTSELDNVDIKILERLHGVSLTKTGKELYKVVEKEFNQEYNQDLISYFKNYNLSFREVQLDEISS